MVNRRTLTFGLAGMAYAIGGVALLNDLYPVGILFCVVGIAFIALLVIGGECKG